MASLVVNGNVKVQGNMQIHGNLELINGDVIIHNGDILFKNGDIVSALDDKWLKSDPIWYINNKIIKLDIANKRILVNDIEVKNSIELGKILFEEMEIISSWRNGLTSVDFFNY